MKQIHFVAAASAIVRYFNSGDVRRSLVLVIATAMLAGCSETEQLAECVADTEPTLLLRQLNMDGGTKERFNQCVAARNKLDCQTAYLGRNNLLEACMKRNGFVSAPLRLDCLSKPVDELKCFRKKWLQDVRSVFASD